MIPIENKVLDATRRCFAFLVLAVCLGSLAANAAPQGNAGKTPCRITNINAQTGVVTASVIDGGTTTVKSSSTGQSFRFFVKDSDLLKSLKEGQEIVADFKTQQAWTSAGANGPGVRLGGILGASFGPVDGARPVGPIDGARPVGPIDGAHPLGPVDGAKPVGPIDGSRPLGPVDGAKPLGPVDGARPVGPIDGAKPIGPIDGARPVGPIDGAHAASPGGGTNFGPVDGARPAEPNCAITAINPVTGVVSAKDNRTGQSLQFTVKNSAMLGSLKIGQAVFANFSNRQVFLDGNTFAGNITSVGH